MLTPLETMNTRDELQENYERLGESEDEVLMDGYLMENNVEVKGVRQ